MGIRNLSKFLEKHAPKAIKNVELQNFTGCKVAIDASNNIYRSLIGSKYNKLSNSIESGEKVITHLAGIYSDAINMVKFGFEPIYVFEGRPPKLKYAKLNERELARGEAKKSLDALKEKIDTLADIEAALRLAQQAERLFRKTVRPPPNYKAECKKLLGLMGIPYIQAPSEAEAQCATICKAGKVYAAVSDDWDTLAFSSPILLRGFANLRFKKFVITEVNLQSALDQLNLSQESFIDLCILLGSDYCDIIQGIGPYHALSLVKKYGNIETIIKNINLEETPLPNNFNYEDIRKLFLSPNVIEVDQGDLEWGEPNESGLIEYLIEENGFDRNHVVKGIDVLHRSLNFNKSASIFR